jgi:hypothetical protein
MSHLRAIHDISEEIGIPVSCWPGQCYAIACLLVERDIVDDEAVYGHWLGPVHPESEPFGARRHLPFQNHGWVLRPNGSIVDPTRWVFEAAQPYVYEGPPDFYDEGGDAWRSSAARPFPAGEGTIVLDLQGDAGQHVRNLAVRAGSPMLPWTLNMAQVFWLANLPFADLEPFAVELYEAIARSKAGAAAIPIDNRQRAERSKRR